MRSLVPRSPSTILGMGARVNSRTTRLPRTVLVGIFTVAFLVTAGLGGPCTAKKVNKNRKDFLFWHYTDKKGADGINQSRKIRPSRTDAGRDAVGGNGFYVTDLNPFKHSKTEILNNNYGQENAGNKNLADYVVRLRGKTDRWKVQQVRKHVYVIKAKRGKTHDTRVGGSRTDTIAHPKPDYNPGQ